jgi:hypothetical protein
MAGCPRLALGKAMKSATEKRGLGRANSTSFMAALASVRSVVTAVQEGHPPGRFENPAHDPSGPAMLKGGTTPVTAHQELLCS